MTGGCWSASDVDGKGYVNVLGIDFKDGQFIAYAQMMDFSSVAKSESGGKSGSNPTNYVGRGIGKSLNNATDDLYRSSQVQLNWGQMSTLIVTESALKAKGFKIIDMINRYPEVRYNTWLYVTKESIEDLVMVNSLFKLSTLYTILHEPRPNYSQYSILPPVTMFKYVASFNEDAKSAYLPCIGLIKDQWKQSDKKLPMPAFKGAYFQKPNGDTAFLNWQQLNGLHWMQKDMKRAPLLVSKDGVDYANLNIGRPKVKIKPILKGDSVTFNITVKLTGSLYEYNEPIAYKDMAEIAQDIVAKQIMKVYKEGFKKGIDIFSLGQVLRHKHPSAWHRLSKDGNQLVIDANSIEKIEVKIAIPYNGKYKRITSPSR